MKNKRILSVGMGVLLLFGFVFSFAACDDGTGLIGKAYENELRFYCSDSDIEVFLNDYYSRNIRNGDDAVSGQRMGEGGTYQKLWETDSLVWFDSRANGIGSYDAMGWLRSYLDNLTVDKYGYVFSEDKSIIVASENGPWQGMGWPFPSAVTNVGTGDKASYGQSFNTKGHGWTIEDGTVVQNNGAAEFTYTGAKNAAAVLQAETKDKSGYGYDTTLFGNFVEIELILEDLSNSGGLHGTNIEDWYLSWQTEEDGDEWFSVSQKEWAVNPKEASGNTSYRVYFPMYMHEKWDKKHVKNMRIVIQPKEGEALNLKGRLDYIYMMSDTRHSVNIGNYICSLERYTLFNNDIEFLKENIVKARRAMQFQLGALQGESGLLDLSWFRSHALAVNDGQSNVSDRYYGYISCNGFWDMYPTGHKNAEANYYFYMSLQSLLKMERYLQQAGLTVDEPAVVANPVLGEEDVQYAQTVESLETLAEQVRENICKDVADGGFWNPETGRFAWAIYDEDNTYTGTQKGAAMDYGHTELNLRMIYEGIATTEQTDSIMSWINGERIVVGDTSTGKDIYFYDFAPRVTTKENTSDYGIIWLNGNTEIENRWSFGKNVESGGAIMFVSYYDLMTRMQTLGVDDSYNRLKEIAKWYADVSAAAGASQGKTFYDNYYNQIWIDKMFDPTLSSAQKNDLRNQYIVHSVERGKQGALGLDSEFMESSLLYATIPYGFFGLETGIYNTLTIAPNLPTDVSYFGMSNLMYAEVPYDCVITNNSVKITNIDGNTDGLYIKMKFKKPKGEYTVKVNGKNTPNYTENGEYVEVTVPFTECSVTVK